MCCRVKKNSEGLVFSLLELFRESGNFIVAEIFAFLYPAFRPLMIEINVAVYGLFGDISAGKFSNLFG